MTPLQKGDTAPDFSVRDQDGNFISKSDFEGHRWILFFYPKASTPGCKNEVCNLRDHYQELKDEGYSLVGVSADSQERQKNFHMKNNLPFPLLADTEKKVINAYGVWGPKKFMGKTFDGIHRKTFIIDEKGIIERVIDKVKTKEHAAQILDNDF